MLHSREGHSVPIKKVQKPKIKAITLLFFFIIASIRLLCERCPTAQDSVSSKGKSKVVHSSLQVTEEKTKRKEKNIRCDDSVSKRGKDDQVVKSLFFSYTKEHIKSRNVDTYSTSLHVAIQNPRSLTNDQSQ